MGKQGRMPRAAAHLRAAAILALGLLAGCGAGSAMPTPSPTPSGTVRSGTVLSDGVLRIGTLLPTSGTDAAAGIAQLAAVFAAVRQVNAAGGVLGQRVEIVSRSSGDDFDELEDGFAALVERHVDAVIGPASGLLASRSAQLAAAAGIPVVTPAVPEPILANEAGWLFRTVPGLAHQGVLLGRLLPERSQPRVALIYADGPWGIPLVAPLRESLATHGGELVASARIATGMDVADLVTRIAASEPDAVVLATGGGGVTRAVIEALHEAGLGGERLWLTSRNAVDYSDSLDDGLLAGANAVIAGRAGDLAFRRLVEREDPAAREFRYVPETFDAAVLVALAAQSAGSDVGSAIRAALREASSGGTPCTSVGECLVVLADGHDPDYDGVSGPLELDAAGEATVGGYGVFVYRADNTAEKTGVEIG